MTTRKTSHTWEWWAGVVGEPGYRRKGVRL